MIRQSTGKWLVLIYANGNNDLAPEINNGFEKLSGISVSENIHVLVQFAKASMNLIKKLRTGNFSQIGEEWSGVRRYSISKNSAMLIDEFESLNMADPKTLVNFIEWGIEWCKPNKIMLIISGHGAGFAGLMPDFTLKYPQIMRFGGFVGVFNEVKKKTGRTIDYLFFDTCYMNMFEIWYELADLAYDSVRYLVVSRRNMQSKGFPLDFLVQCLGKISEGRCSDEEFCHQLLKELNNDESKNLLIGVDLVKSSFIEFKTIFSRMIEEILDNVNDLFIKKFIMKRAGNKEPIIELSEVYDIFCGSNSKKIRTDSNFLKLNRSLKRIVITEDKESEAIFFFPNDSSQYKQLAQYYECLGFVRDSYWKTLLRRVFGDVYELALHSTHGYMPMPVGSLAAVLKSQNPRINNEEIWNTFYDLGWIEKPNHKFLHTINKQHGCAGK